MFDVCFFQRGAAEHHLHSQLLLCVLIALLHQQEVRVGQTFGQCADLVLIRALGTVAVSAPLLNNERGRLSRLSLDRGERIELDQVRP